MSKADQKVMSAVEAAIKKDPGASVDELFEIARGVNPATAKLTKRQFHARYPLQVKRRMNPPKRRRRRTKSARSVSPGNGTAREAVRASFLKFASDLAGAEARKDVVRVVAGVDRYVDEVMKATAGK